MTRLLQAMAGAPQGGAEAFFERLAPALARAGVEQHLLIRTNAKRAAFLRESGLSVEELGFGGALDLLTRLRMSASIKRFRPDVVLCWMNRAARFLPASDGFVPVGRLGGYYDLKYYRNCQHLIGNTPHIRDWIIEQGWPAERAHYVPNFVAEPKATALPRADHQTPDGVPLLVALGRLHANKGFDVLLEALARLPTAFLWLAGDGPLRRDLEAQAERLGLAGRVRFLGWRDDVDALYASGDAFVCPSRHEPLGNVVIEAWAAGKPVAACASQGPTQLIVDGVNGLLSPIDDAPALAANLERLLADRELAARIGGEGRLAYEARFTEAAVVRAYLDFLERIRGR